MIGVTSFLARTTHVGSQSSDTLALSFRMISLLVLCNVHTSIFIVQLLSSKVSYSCGKVAFGNFLFSSNLNEESSGLF